MLVRFSLIVACSALLLGSCSWKADTRPSVIVILVESLGFDAFSCGEGIDAGHFSGLQVFCDEAVRFTHAYTPSIMSQATVASILTAKYPHEHGVRHNGAQALSSRAVTVAEAAIQRGYDTAFFSGGPPIWRRNGLNQGFEIFDDNIPVSQKGLYRPAVEVIRSFLNWQESETPRGRFLSFLFFSDLQFIDTPTANALGEIRESSYKSQVEEVDEALGVLIRELKQRNIWDSADVFLVGLDASPAEARINEAPMMNLFSESTRTTLMIKPSRRLRDSQAHWKVDANVSLVDVGATLFELIDGRSSRNTGPQEPKSEGEIGPPEAEGWKPVSLREVLIGPEPQWFEERLVLTESAWAQWHGLGDIRAALRRGHYLYLFDEHDQFFNTLTDSLEILPLRRGSDQTVNTRTWFREALEGEGFTRWKPLERVKVEKSSLGRDLWRDRSPDGDTLARLKTLSRRYPEDAELRGWRAIVALRQGDWDELKEAAVGKEIQRPLWAYVAARNLGESVSVPDVEPCLAFLIPGEPARKLPKNCPLEMLQDLLTWQDGSQSDEERNRAMERFLRAYSAKALGTRIAEHNQVAGMSWDTATSVGDPHLIDLILALPEMRRVRPAVRSRLAADRR